MSKTKIPYAEESWSPTSGCSFGCQYCWSRAIAHRFGKSFAPTFHAERLADPLHWRRPRRVLVCFNGDLFDPQITNAQIAAVWGVMAACPAHTFLVLTKRAERMAAWFDWVAVEHSGGASVVVRNEASRRVRWSGYSQLSWPLPNVWLGERP